MKLDFSHCRIEYFLFANKEHTVVFTIKQRQASPLDGLPMWYFSRKRQGRLPPASQPRVRPDDHTFFPPFNQSTSCV
jgi:hypothetical protein